MTQRIAAIVAVYILALSAAHAGENVKGAAHKTKYEQPFFESGVVKEIPSRPVPRIDPLQSPAHVGTFTSLTGWYDYQSNGGSVQQIRMNPANGNISTTWMTAFDSLASGHNASRRVMHAYSSNSGASWTNFNSLYVPDRRAGFPSIDLGQGPFAGAPIIANHSIITGGQVQATIFVDFPEGGGAFSEIGPPTGFGSDETIWPYVAATTDGSVVIAGSRSTAATVHYASTADFVSWSPLAQMIGPVQSGGRYPVQSNGTGRVGIVANNNNPVSLTTGGNWFTESTNNGVTWSTPVNLYGFRESGVDTFLAYVHSDFVYNGNNPLFVFSETHNTLDMDQISFWSQATGFKVAVAHDPTKYFFDAKNQRFHALRLGWPSIGLSGNTIVVAFQAFEADTDRLGWNYSDLWFVTSGNGGNTWSTPQNITNTRFVDERYPSVSKWNPPGQFNMVWTQKAGASGLYAFPGAQQPPNPDTVRTFQVFQKILLTDVKSPEEIATGFRLNQNYPNPFNPATKIGYTVAQAGLVSLKVYNMLGEEVATLLNEELQPGTYQATFNASSLSSGVYMYKLKAGSYTESKRMLLLK